MSDITKNIQTIAKTDILEEKIANAQANIDKVADQVERIVGERGIGQADGNTLIGASGADGISVIANQPSSSGTGTIDTAGYKTGANSDDPSWNTMAPTSAQIMWSARDLINTTAGNQVTAGGAANGLGNAQQQKTDLSGKAVRGGSGTGTTSTPGDNNTGVTGGSDILNMAQGAPSDETLIKLSTDAATQGVPSAQIVDLTDKYVQDSYGEPGSFTAEQLADNRTITPQMSPDPNALYKERLRSVVGFDGLGTISAITGSMIAVKVILDDAGNFPIPNKRDITAAGMGPWEAFNIPPNKLYWNSGYFWIVNGFSIYSGATPGDAAEVFLDVAIKPTYPNAYWDPTTLSISGASPPYGGSFDYYHDQGDPPNTATLIQQTCSGSGQGPEVCTATNPLEEYWPKTGTSVVNLTTGSVVVSAYDSERTLLYAEGDSIVRLKIGDGMNIDDSRFMDVEPAVDGGIMLVVRDSSFNYQFANYYNKDRVLTRAQITQAEYPYFRPKR